MLVGPRFAAIRRAVERAWGRVRWKMVAIIVLMGGSTVLFAGLAVVIVNVVVRRESANVAEKQIQTLVQATGSIASAVLDNVDSCDQTLLTSLLRLDSQLATGSAVNVLLQLAVSIRTHGRGGMLLVVPTASDAWTESILQPITYSVVPAFSGLAALMRQDRGGKPTRRWEDALGRAVDGIAGLTAVDGATLITADYNLLAFGAKIVRRAGSQQVTQVIVTEPIEGGSPLIVEPALFGGTRHLSAAQFVHDQRDAIALVASQDGRFTVFAWSPTEEMVHAHRIDALLL